MNEGDVVLTPLPQANGLVKLRPAILLRQMPGFGELFRMLSWQEVGAASMLSRATAGVSSSTVIFSLPGSLNAVRLAMEKLIGPELGHVVLEIKKHAPRSN